MNAPGGGVSGAVEAAARARAAVESLARVCGAGQGYGEVSDVYDVAVELAGLAAVLPQVLDRARCWLLAEQDAGRVGDDRSSGPGGRHAADGVQGAARSLAAAGRCASSSAVVLDHAAQGLSSLRSVPAGGGGS